MIVGPDGAAWVTDGGQNAIIRVDPISKAVKAWPLPALAAASISIPLPSTVGVAFGSPDKPAFMVGLIPRLEKWMSGMHPRASVLTDHRHAFGRHLLRVACRQLSRRPAPETGETTVIEPKTKDAGTRRVWSDSQGASLDQRMERGELSVYDPASKSWTDHKLPGDAPHAYAVYVDDRGKVWVSDFGANAILSFDPKSQVFERFPSDKPDAAVRQLNGRAGEVWGAESPRIAWW